MQYIEYMTYQLFLSSMNYYTDSYVQSSNDGPTAVRARERQERQHVSLSRLLSRCLFHDNDEVVLETARALGNLTRSRDVTRFLVNSRADEALLLLLDHRSVDIVAAASGALVNISADPMWRRCYISPTSPNQSEKPNPFEVCLGVLRRSALKDLRLSALLCQVVYNLLIRDDNDRDLDVYSEIDRDGGGRGTGGDVISMRMSRNVKSASTGIVTCTGTDVDNSSSDRLKELIPLSLASSVEELVECAEDLAETFVSLTGKHSNNSNAHRGGISSDSSGLKKTNKNGMGNVNMGEITSNEIGPMGHVFMAAELQNTSENMRKYTDFATIGRAVLTSLRKL